MNSNQELNSLDEGKQNCVDEKRMQLKAAILDVARKAFLEQGIKAVKMDDVAASLRISKRTLYETYDNKLALLHDVLLYINDENHEYMRDYSLKCDNVMDIIIEFFRRQTAFYQETNPLFFKDLQRYPELTDELKKMRQRNTKNSHDFLVRGVEEGYFRGDVNYELLSCIGRDISKLQHYPEYQNRTAIEIFRTILCTLIRGICTAKGIARIDEFLDNLENV